MLRVSIVDVWLEKKEKDFECDWGEPAKDPLTVKSGISLGLKYSEWMNSRNSEGSWSIHLSHLQ